MTQEEPAQVPVEENDDEPVIVPIDSEPVDTSDPVIKKPPQSKPDETKTDSKASSDSTPPPAGFSLAYMYYIFNQLQNFGSQLSQMFSYI